MWNTYYVALIIQALHPSPSPSILLPYMHSNLAQIERSWIATSLLNSSIPQEPLEWIITHPQIPFQNSPQTSHPNSIIPWNLDCPYTGPSSCLPPIFVPPTLALLSTTPSTNCPPRGSKGYPETQSTSRNHKPPNHTPRMPGVSSLDFVSFNPPTNYPRPASSKTGGRKPRSTPAQPITLPKQKTLHSFLSLSSPPPFSMAEEMDT